MQDNTASNVAFGDIAKAQLATAIAMQKEFVGSFEETTRAWLARTRSECDLATKFVSNLTSARSIPEVISAYQELAIRQFEILAEDGRMILANREKFLRANIPLVVADSSPGLST